MLLNCGVGKDSWRVPWSARRSNQSIPKEISPKYLLEGLMLKLKFQYFGHLMRRTYWKRPWCWERLKAGGERDNRGRDGWMASPTQWTWVWVNSGSWWWIVRPGVLQSMGLQRVGHEWATEPNYILNIIIKDQVLVGSIWIHGLKTITLFISFTDTGNIMINIFDSYLI